MASDTHIAWTDSTFNPWEGCTKVSPGCLHCYAETRNARFGGGTAPNWGAGKPRRRTSASNWNDPKRWNRESQARFQAFNQEAQGSFGHLSEMMEEPTRPRVFCASLADWLDAEVPIEWLADLLVLIFDCGFLDWQLLTKRPENFKHRLIAASLFIRNHRDATERNHAIRGWIDGWVDGKPPHNVWVGTSVEDQLRADVRIPRLLEIPAVVHFLSCEPLLERVSLKKAFWRDIPLSEVPGSALDDGAAACKEFVEELKVGVDWVIVGGESGPGARPTSVDAIERVIFECRDAGVACFVKQLGAKPIRGEPEPTGKMRTIEGRRQMQMKADVLVLRHPKGGDPAEWPERFRVMEFPEVTS